MKVLRIQPQKYPEVIEIDGSLESLQKEVAGPIQAVYPWDDPVALICNEEGKLAEDAFEHYNRVLCNEIGIPYDIVVGTFLISISSYCVLTIDWKGFIAFLLSSSSNCFCLSANSLLIERARLVFVLIGQSAS